MPQEIQVPLLDLILCLSEAMDLISPMLVNHHKQVAYIAFSIAAELILPIEQRNDLLLSGALHDSGAFSLKERLDTLQFEIENPHQHAEMSYRLIKIFEPFSIIADIARFHHVLWNYGNGVEFNGKPVTIGSHILHLADRIAVLINKQQEILGQVKDIRAKIKGGSGKIFMPELVDAFMSLSSKEYFWFDLISSPISPGFARKAGINIIKLDITKVSDLSNLFLRIIDFRSRFTATHSTGVAAVATALARFMDFSETDCQMMKIAGHLHDLGKLAIATEILDKPAKLTADEFNIIKSHPFHTYRILEPITDLDVINTWAAFHHERLDGSGYPFHYNNDNLPIGSRIIAIADILTAITEDRPYRKRMPRNEALQVLREMVKNSTIDPNAVSTLILHYDEIESIRMAEQIVISQENQKFWLNTSHYS